MTIISSIKTMSPRIPPPVPKPKEWEVVDMASPATGAAMAKPARQIWIRMLEKILVCTMLPVGCFNRFFLFLNIMGILSKGIGSAPRKGEDLGENGGEGVKRSR